MTLYPSEFSCGWYSAGMSNEGTDIRAFTSPEPNPVLLDLLSKMNPSVKHHLIPYGSLMVKCPIETPNATCVDLPEPILLLGEEAQAVISSIAYIGSQQLATAIARLKITEVCLQELADDYLRCVNLQSHTLPNHVPIIEFVDAANPQEAPHKSLVGRPELQHTDDQIKIAFHNFYPDFEYVEWMKIRVRRLFLKVLLGRVLKNSFS